MPCASAHVSLNNWNPGTPATLHTFIGDCGCSQPGFPSSAWVVRENTITIVVHGGLGGDPDVAAFIAALVNKAPNHTIEVHDLRKRIIVPCPPPNLQLTQPQLNALLELDNLLAPPIEEEMLSAVSLGQDAGAKPTSRRKKVAAKATAARRRKRTMARASRRS
jgi:hypothetical protein